MYEDTSDHYDGYISYVGTQSGTELTLRTWRYDENGENEAWERTLYYGRRLCPCAGTERSRFVVLRFDRFALLRMAQAKIGEPRICWFVVLDFGSGALAGRVFRRRRPVPCLKPQTCL